MDVDEVEVVEETSRQARDAMLLANAVDVDEEPEKRVRRGPQRLVVGEPQRRKRKAPKEPEQPRAVRHNFRRDEPAPVKVENVRTGDINCPSCGCGLRIGEGGCNTITCTQKVPSKEMIGVPIYDRRSYL